MCRAETDVSAASPDTDAASASPTLYPRQDSRECSSWLVAVRHFRQAVAGGPGPMSTRGALATMPFRSLLFRNWALCAPADSGTANNGWDWLSRLPIPYADRASSSSIAQGLTAAT